MPGLPRLQRPSGPTPRQPRPGPAQRYAGGGGWKPQPQADEEVARKAEAALMILEGAGSQPVWWRTRLGTGFLFSPLAPLSSPLLP